MDYFVKEMHTKIIRGTLKILTSQQLIIIILAIILDCLHAVYLNDYDETHYKSKISKLEDMDFEPIIPESINVSSNKIIKYPKNNIFCNDFDAYASNCTSSAAEIYNSSMKPPSPSKINDWCRALKHLWSCATDWNYDCKDVSDSQFSEDNISGHMHVINSICSDVVFLAHYDNATQCIVETSDMWESCYTTFKNVLEAQRNTSLEWTHYLSHFHLCCARAQFRRCTLDFLFAHCTRDEAVVMQKFSTVVSEGDVFQDCEQFMVYTNCPGGDPRPTSGTLAQLMMSEDFGVNASVANELGSELALIYFVCLFLQINLL